MISIQYPEPEFRIKREGNKDFLFDPMRKKWIVLTPEEWVRQNFIQYLVRVKNYPAPLIAVEKEIQLNELKKRFDILVYNNHHLPWMMVECKAAGITLDDAVLQQVLRYNISVPVNYIIITNGEYTWGWRKADRELVAIETLRDRT